MDSTEHVCPECGQPVDTVIRRHKTLGAWVPVWVAGPCRNPKCEAYAAEGALPEHKLPATPAPTKKTETETVAKKS
ncbi:hypothetical protein SSP24_51220 [Streptomyces spinoverrucosus]|uniref:Uncharacterized protein n=1 Tax=Streptomyces spinoverrucosus TaxID=284043 RepID=A0A4Y3VKU3_9ACTN|nr:hypothetical protein [Streptomyces spinoverrucosus]GEC07467.1 hypothetical protein SSP24_51220 [Streptomyces spinoverrucosus]GHB68247.1 hypothetical protein GCM10010397_43000 [Streptomyces spinoverrucosus]